MILIISSNTGRSAKHRLLLEKVGHIVETVSDTAQALSVLNTDPACELVLCDVRLGTESGFSVLDLLANRYPNVAVVLTSSRASSATVRKAFRKGAVDFLLRPISVGSLTGCVDRALDTVRLRDQSSSYVSTLEQLILQRGAQLNDLNLDLQTSRETLIEALGRVLDMRDGETEGHSRRVMAYTYELAKAMHLSRAELEVVVRGAYLHDIGKVAIPDSILLKPGPLTAAERDVMRRHCEHGYEIVSKIASLADAAEIVLAHQEAYDGTGYPRGLHGEQISLGARIFAVADTLDAITSDRPYRRAASFECAAREIERCCGTQFDPQVVSVFKAIPPQTWEKLRNQVSRPVSAMGLLRGAAA